MHAFVLGEIFFRLFGPGGESQKLGCIMCVVNAINKFIRREGGRMTTECASRGVQEFGRLLFQDQLIQTFVWANDLGRCVAERRGDEKLFSSTRVIVRIYS